MQGFLRRRIPLIVRRFVTMVPALVVFAVGRPVAIARLSQVALSFGIPFALVPLLLFCRYRMLIGGPCQSAIHDRGGLGGRRCRHHAQRRLAVLRRLSLAFVAALILLATGCGGGDEGSNGSSSETVVQDERLTQATWDEYEADEAAYEGTMKKSLAAFEDCEKTAAASGDLGGCVGEDVEAALTATEGLDETLLSLEQSVAGECADALTEYAGGIKIYASTLSALESVVDSGSPPEVAAAVDDVQTGRENALASAEAFRRACRPT
jgi:hypothetical protein